MLVRTRFAPSPTGYLHLGGARTALYAWLYARKNQGKFILRIEDTDRERSTEAAIQAILEGMNWLGLDWDEGPFYQTQRFDRYKEISDKLLSEGKAYRCYCSKERLENLKTQQVEAKEKPRYDGHCRELNLPQTQEPFVLRFKNPLTGNVIVDDKVYGQITFKNEELDDLIIARSDGTPTYNFCVVVDDLDMQVTHVIRGDDHINNTPRQINILTALGATLPVYAHVPIILGSDGKKMSKREGALGIMDYQKQGFLPQALLNYLVRLGWSHGDKEIFSKDELVELFDINALNKSAAAFSPEKLLWLNQHYIKTLPAPEIAKYLQWHLQQQGIDFSKGPLLESVIDCLRERAKDLAELAQKSRYFFEDINNYAEPAASQHLTPTALPVLEAVQLSLQDLEPWSKENIHQKIQQVMETLSIKMAQLAQPIRVAVTGDTVSPSIDVTLELIGKQRVLDRLQKAITYIRGY